MSLPDVLARSLLILLLLSCSSNVKEALPATLYAKVIAIKDGDTIEILHNGKPLRIRLAHVDCPEIRKSQPFGKAAKQLTSELCFGQEVKVVNEGTFDQYGRLIGVVMNSKNRNVNMELVAAGMAWHFTRYSSDTLYANLEIAARENQVGLWVEDHPIPPWEWRNGKDK